MTDETLSALADKHPCAAYMHTYGTMALIEHLWDRIDALEGQLKKANERAASDAMARAYSNGGGHGF